MSWWQTAKVGDKVVCIKEGSWTLVVDGTAPPGPQPVRGKVYTVASLIKDMDLVWISLAECSPHDEFRADRFRPVQPRKTDISIFTQMLHRAPERADA